jgi:hypothetical protein
MTRIRIVFVPCHRTGQLFDLTEHERCPYCYGAQKDVATGDHGEFCDFDPDRDPVGFGFPAESTRLRTC